MNLQTAWASAVVLLFALFAALRPEARRVLVYAAVLVVSAVTLAFWWLDLRHARFAWTFGAIPLGALLALAAPWGALRQRAGAGALIGLAGVFVLMVRRSDNGCTGVSNIYGAAMAAYALFLTGVGPWVPGALAPVQEASGGAPTRS